MLAPQVISISTSFDYEEKFVTLTLQEQALDTKKSFLDFCQNTADRLVEQGRQLYEFCYSCKRDLGEEKGKAVFEEWIESGEFGATKYIAKLAMDFSPWYLNLPSRLQRLVQLKALNHSAAALKQLTKVPLSLLEELLTRSGRLTQASIKSAIVGFCDFEENQPKFRRGGYAKVIKKDFWLEGIVGEIANEPDEQGNVILLIEEEEFPLKVEDLKQARKPRKPQISNSIAKEEGTFFSQTQVDELIAKAVTDAISKYDEDKTALSEVDPEVEGLKASLLAQTQENEKLRQELAEVRSYQLESKNEQLQKRVFELENLLTKSENRTWNHTVDQVDSVTNYIELPVDYEAVLKRQQQLEKELADYKSANTNEVRSETVTNSSSNVEKVATEICAALELFQIPGWVQQGYRDSQNRFHQGLNALIAFAREASPSSYSEPNWSVA